MIRRIFYKFLAGFTFVQSADGGKIGEGAAGIHRNAYHNFISFRIFMESFYGFFYIGIHFDLRRKTA